MPRRTIAERIAAEKERRDKLDANLKTLQAQSAKVERAKDTRRKVLLGTLVMEELNASGAFTDTLTRWLRQRLPATLTRDTDRELMADFMKEQRTGSGNPPPPGDNDAT